MGKSFAELQSVLECSKILAFDVVLDPQWSSWELNILIWILFKESDIISLLSIEWNKTYYKC
jgi:hypothetical protein